MKKIQARGMKQKYHQLLRYGPRSWMPLGIAIFLGIISVAIQVSNITVPIRYLANGDLLLLAPTEIPIVLSSILAGLFGVVFSAAALIISGLSFEPGVLITFVLSHVVIGVWAMFAYRLSYQRTTMPLRLVAWVGIVIVYYILLCILFPLFYPEQYHFSLTAIMGFIQAVWLPTFYEFLGTLLITTWILIALPEHYRRPLWYKLKPTTPSAAEVI
jgi:hypothetical protein